MQPNKAEVEVRRYAGVALAPYLQAIARLRITVFREFPYLYDGSLAYEERYLKTYLDSPRSVAVLAFAAGDVIGASTGLPLADETIEFRAPFERSGIGPAQVFYCAESVLEPAYRGRGLYRRFFAGREAHARELGGFTTSAFCAVARPSNHPLRPPGYRPLDAAWLRLGYALRADLTTTFAWKDVDRGEETAKTMTFWLKDLV